LTEGFDARAIERDRREVGEELWERFNAPRADAPWYYRSLAAAFARLSPGLMADELDRTLSHIEP
jgi:hypothetical protein